MPPPKKSRIPDMGGVLGLCFFLLHPMSETLFFWGVARIAVHPVHAGMVGGGLRAGLMRSWRKTSR